MISKPPFNTGRRRIAVTAWSIASVAFWLVFAMRGYGFDATVITESGPIRGSGGAIASFKGIPYAAPPIGQLRWRPPVPPSRWTEVRDATTPGPPCPQPAPLPTSEDCLTLNVWTPAVTPTSRLPVMVWIHGGGFVVGSGAVPLFDGEALARRGVVVVTLNYRLGALGFFAHPALSAESPQRVSGNYGILDQIAALQWVRNNISRFGGDPRNVTLFGQSAGAYSATILTVSPLANGLFRRAVLQSLPLMFESPRWLRKGTHSAEAEGQATGADIAALRALSAPDVIRQLPAPPTFSTGMHPFPLVDGWVLPDDPGNLIGTKRQHAMPALIGYAAEEGKFFLADAPKTLDQARAFIGARFGDAAVETVLRTYHVETDADVPEALSTFFGDHEVLASTVLTARAMAKRGEVHLFQFSRVAPKTHFNSATHTSEIPYVFGTLRFAVPGSEAQDVALSEAMSGAWIRFATTGDPNGPGLPAWPSYAPPAFQYVNYGNRVSVESGYRTSQIEFAERLLADQRHAASR